jgi:hypothetical protein
MRKAVMPFVLSVGLIAVWAAPADAASTRAEYIAQADPICHSTNVAVAQAARGIRSDERQGRFKVAARKLRKEIPLQSAGVEQIAAIEPPPADAQLLGTWVQMLRSQLPVAAQLATDFARGRIRKAAKVDVRFGKLIQQTEALVTSFGFQYCQQL